MAKDNTNENATVIDDSEKKTTILTKDNTNENATATTNKYDPYEPVTVMLFKDNGKYKNPVFVGINGKNYLVERGKQVQVPQCVAEVLNHSAEQDSSAIKFMEQTMNRFAEMMEKL